MYQTIHVGNAALKTSAVGISVITPVAVYRLIHVAFRTMPLSAKQAERALIRWREMHERRDPLVRQAHAAGLSINRIHTLTSIGRSTIYRILETEPTTTTPT